jgi:hypothetical protein
MRGKGYIDKFIEREELYYLIDEKLKSLGINNYDYPLDSMKIASIYKDTLTVDIIEFPSKRLGGLLYKDPEGFQSFIALNSNKSIKARNFDCMHELIHYWFHPPGHKLCYNKDFIVQNKGIEWHANEGAAQVLMPEKLFKERYQQFQGNISRLSNCFNVSEQSIKFRIKNLNVKLLSSSYSELHIKKTHCFCCGNADLGFYDNYCKICGEDSYCFGHGYRWETYSPGPNQYNECTNDEYCGIELDSNARFCQKCGAPSILTTKRKLNYWHEELNVANCASHYEFR